MSNETKRINSIRWTLHKGLIFATTNETGKSAASNSADQQSNGCETGANSNIHPIAWISMMV